MENNINNKLNSNTENTTVVLNQRNISYGIASGLDLTRPYLYNPDLAYDLAFRMRFFIGEMFGLLFVLFSTFYIFAVPEVLTRPERIKALFNGLLKRTIDIVGAVAGLLLASPFMLLLPILIKLDSPGPVFYTQLRVGVNRRKEGRRYHQKVGIRSEQRTRDRRRENYHGKPFRVIKFRTMVQDAEKKSGPVWAAKNDPRITRMGAFMRKTRLDEIPQFINILKGDMALVGPRPERPSFVQDLSTKVDDYIERLEVKPGLTGLAQVENGYDSSLASVTRKVKYDLQYIKNWTLFYDIKIILKTFVVVFTGKGAC
ncbi:MAG: sugar transferase [candidate division Zixibacteria bacterium]|nr:sugar transferase [candidate division Zixibacteria bacterium]MDD5425415.1 sugar transferase [candidate division Zixibacteria bacterium]